MSTTKALSATESSRHSTSSCPDFNSTEKVPQTTVEELAKSSPRTPFDFVFRHAASSAAETKYLKHVSILGLARLILSVLTVGFGAALVGLEARVLQAYHQTILGPDFYLSLWPSDIDVVPTTLPLVAGCIAIFLLLLYILASVVPSPRSLTAMLSYCYLVVATLSFLPLLATLVYESVLIREIFSLLPVATKRPTIQSWTCTLATNANGFHSDASTLGLAPGLVAGGGKGLSAPDGFPEICEWSRLGFGMVVALFVLGVFGLMVAMAGVLGQLKIATERRRRYADVEGVEKEVIETDS